MAKRAFFIERLSDGFAGHEARNFSGNLFGWRSPKSFEKFALYDQILQAVYFQLEADWYKIESNFFFNKTLWIKLKY